MLFKLVICSSLFLVITSGRVFPRNKRSYEVRPCNGADRDCRKQMDNLKIARIILTDDNTEPIAWISSEYLFPGGRHKPLSGRRESNFPQSQNDVTSYDQNDEASYGYDNAPGGKKRVGLKRVNTPTNLDVQEDCSTCW